MFESVLGFARASPLKPPPDRLTGGAMSTTRTIKARLPDALLLGMILISVAGLAYRWLHQ